jgi:hypothetical protein
VAGSKQTPQPIPLNCQQCGKPLRHIGTKAKPTRTHIYSCPTDGFFELTADRFEQVGPMNSELDPGKL